MPIKIQDSYKRRHYYIDMSLFIVHITKYNIIGILFFVRS